MYTLEFQRVTGDNVVIAETKTYNELRPMIAKMLKDARQDKQVKVLLSGEQWTIKFKNRFKMICPTFFDTDKDCFGTLTVFDNYEGENYQ